MRLTRPCAASTGLTMGTAEVKAPAYIQFYPTLRCNYSCSFCFNRHLAQTDDISVEQFEKIASVCRDLGTEHIDILGGEPTLHPGILDITGLICEKGLKTTISTNGSHPDVLYALSENFDKNSVGIGISINDSRMPEGLHDYILANRPVLKTVFTGARSSENAMLPYLGMQDMDCRLIFRDAADRADLENCPGFETFLNSLEVLNRRYPRVKGVFCGGFIPDTKQHPQLAGTRCPAGTTKLSVMSDGSVYPCYLFFRYKQFRLGNILEDDFSEIWNHRILDFFRKSTGSPCANKSCGIHRQCRGGCPAMSYLAYNRLDAPDPRCP